HDVAGVTAGAETDVVEIAAHSCRVAAGGGLTDVGRDDAVGLHRIFDGGAVKGVGGGLQIGPHGSLIHVGEDVAHPGAVVGAIGGNDALCHPSARGLRG